MSITLLKYPLDMVPAHNDCELKATSNNYAQPDFHFYVTVTLPLTSDVFIYKILPVNTNELYFNFYDIINKYVENFYPFSLYGWQDVVNGIIDISYSIDEFYSGSVNVTGTTGVFQAWNGALTFDERARFDPVNYVVANSRNAIWLNNLESTVYLKSDQDLVLYFLQAGINQVDQIEITTYNATDGTGSIVGTTVIPNLSYPYSTTLEQYKCINVGFRGLDNISSGDVTGSYPIITGSVLAYTIAVRYNNGATHVSTIEVIIDQCAPKYTKESLYYLNRKGAYDFINCYGNHKASITSNKSFYKGLNVYNEGSFNSGSTTLVASPLSKSKKVLASTYEKFRTLQTDWLTDLQEQGVPFTLR